MRIHKCTCKGNQDEDAKTFTLVHISIMCFVRNFVLFINIKIMTIA